MSEQTETRRWTIYVCDGCSGVTSEPSNLIYAGCPMWRCDGTLKPVEVVPASFILTQPLTQLIEKWEAWGPNSLDAQNCASDLRELLSSIEGKRDE